GYGAPLRGRGRHRRGGHGGRHGGLRHGHGGRRRYGGRQQHGGRRRQHGGCLRRDATFGASRRASPATAPHIAHGGRRPHDEERARVRGEVSVGGLGPVRARARG